MQLSGKITPCLWFDSDAQPAAELYTSVFPNSKILKTSHYTEAGREVHGREPGSVMTVAFELDGQPFTALNGGPMFKFSEAVSFQVTCESQEEVDYYWQRLTADGGQEGPCGWLKDRFGLSWQIVPSILPQLMSDGQKARRVMPVMMSMKKLDIDRLRQAAEG